MSFQLPTLGVYQYAINIIFTVGKNYVEQF